MSARATVRFVQGFFGTPRATVEDVRIDIGTGSADAVLLLPRGTHPNSSWIVLPGITVRGPYHPTLQRFTRALATSGAAVLIPDVPSWRALRLDRPAAEASIMGGLELFRTNRATPTTDVRVLGFSFGATHALISCTHPSIRDRVRGVLGFGGYADLHRTLRCMITGEHEWQGRRYQLDPDPYGRWIAVANFLLGAPGMQRMEPVARGAYRLAETAGREGTFAGEAAYDPLKRQIEAELTPSQRELWALIAPPAGCPPPDLAAARELGDAIAAAALRADPLLDPAPALPELHARVTLAHGRTDRLVPFTETLRLRSMLSRADAYATVTGLLSHSAGDEEAGRFKRAGEGVRFLRLLYRMLRAS